ncbi:MAG: hypothetical protein DME04_23315 [Candidatus Rokuibacteriota bacterium]|nr:MAG: hypothetical protein DME04_23315 [Candidatus Rokubacteria bacterium]
MSIAERRHGHTRAWVLGLALVAAACWTGPVAAEPHGPDDRDRSADLERRRHTTASIAKRFIGVPYLWGGESADGFDCSGLVKRVYALAGIAMPHNVALQYKYGVPVSRDELRPGDLVFFDQLRHNGIYIGDGRFVHAGKTGGNVAVSRLEDSWFRTRWFGARRLTSDGIARAGADPRT